MDEVTIGKARLIHGDCMEFLRGLPDGAFELACVDVPYGIGEDKTKRPSRGKTQTKSHADKNWDSKPPEQEYFDELMRVSRNQIIFGANHFISRIPFDSSCWIVWNKKTAGNTADCELAWTSFDTAVRRFDFLWEGFWQENMKNKETRIHTCQKPIALYSWLLSNYAKPGDKILDTHLGSCSSVIAALNLGFEITGCELDADYFKSGVERVRQSQQQVRMFDIEAAIPPKQATLL